MSYNIKEEFVEIDGENFKLRTEFNADEKDASSNVIFFHGLGGSFLNTVASSVSFSARKSSINCILVDLPDSLNAVSRSLAKWTPSRHVQNCRKIFDYIVHQNPNIYPILCGSSFGGYACIKIFSDNLKEVKSVVVVSPVISGELSHSARVMHEPEFLTKMKKNRKIRVNSDIDDNYDWLRFEAWDEWLEEVDIKPDVERIIKEKSGGICVIGGENDIKVPIQQLKYFFSEWGISVSEVQNAGHDYNFCEEKLRSNLHSCFRLIAEQQASAHHSIL